MPTISEAYANPGPNFPVSGISSFLVIRSRAGKGRGPGCFGLLSEIREDPWGSGGTVSLGDGHGPPLLSPGTCSVIPSWESRCPGLT